MVDDHPWLTSQRRVSFARVGVVDPTSISDYEAHGGWAGLRRALSLSPAEVVQEVTDSGLRGRGGAGFPAGIKWKTVLEAASDLKFVACNFDEGDSGTFADRMLVEGDPFTLVEGMTITAHAVGASEGYVYVRSEYPHAVAALRRAIDAAYTHGYLGHDVLGSGLAFDLHVRVGAGAYICGEESSMLESLEGRRGEVRAKPPIPAIKGLWGRPTAVNNVLTLCAVPMILADGGAAYAELGTGRSRGTQVFQLAGNVKQGGHRRAAVRREPARARRGRTAAARCPVVRCGRRRSAARSVPTCRRPASTSPWTTRRWPSPARCSGTAASWSSTRPSTWLGWRASRWSSARSSRAASARRAAWGRPAAWRPSTGSSPGRTSRSQPGAARRPLRDHDQGVAVRDGRADADARAERDQALPRGLRVPRRSERAEHPYERQSIWAPRSTSAPRRSATPSP